MAAGGAPAVVRALEILEHEIRTTMALLGVSRLDDLRPDLVERSVAMAPADVLSAFPLLAEDY